MQFSKMVFDCELSPDMLSLDFLKEVSRLEPFGQDNPQPVFSLTDVVLDSVRFVGKDKNHASMSFRGIPTPIMKFRISEDQFPFRIGDRLSLAVTLSKNEYNGVTSVSVSAKEIRFSSIKDEKYVRSMRGYDRFTRGDTLDRRQIEFITPDRAFISAVYKFIRANGGWKHGNEALCARLHDDGSHVCRTMLAVDVLDELGILIKKGENILLPVKAEKAELENSTILKKLSEQVNYD